MMKRQCDRVLASFIGVSLNSDVARQGSCKALAKLQLPTAHRLFEKGKQQLSPGQQRLDLCHPRTRGSKHPAQMIVNDGSVVKDNAVLLSLDSS